MTRLLAGALVSAAALAAAAPSSAEVFRTTPTAHRVVYVPRDKSVAFHLDSPPSRIVVTQPDTAVVRATGGTSFYIQGKELGETNLLVYGAGGRLAEILDVRVGYDAQALQEDLGIAFPNENIQVRATGEGVLLTGHVSNTGVAGRAKALAEKFAPQSVTSQISVGASQEVVLEVRVMEASRSLLHDVGVNLAIQNSSFQFVTGANGLLSGNSPAGVLKLTGASGSTTIDAQIQALESKGLVRTLARPNLVAISGEKASFLAGGEFPYPVPQTSGGGTTITIEFRKYGVKVDFKPEVLDNGLIRLEVAPEVSKLDQSNSLKIEGFTVPGLITRNTQTVVELKNGASLAIGGLYQRDYQNDVSQVPGLGNLPVLGALFRSASWRRGETELLIIVTPRLVEPGDMAKAQAAVTMPGQEPSEKDLLLMGKSLDHPIDPKMDASRP
ncbi:MAG TPA: type II and III secretion system protein family protein [Phenylobacterium sp.]|uniref:type II and III secretion system protein family protein n=1 Tax=Phenylobacterium sp. TaxID=1871053 RepID=UPI002B47DEEA|nr:type II and III secretion system protein family protein [Phenylobacterium sp.]HKR88606.1 type II and III secretion system protein family protein [Phenylobacterium sp.]